MEIKGIEFNVNAASGSLGWFGEGYWYHKVFNWVVPGFKKTINNLVFVAKTTTWEPRQGNLPLKEDYSPRELFPKCIKVYLLRGFMLNAVNLSGPGFDALLKTKKWQNLDRSFGISFMAVGDTLESMLREVLGFRDRLIKAINRNGFISPFWVQVNISCPNTDQDHQESVAATTKILEMLQPLRNEYGLVIDLKINLLMPNTTIKKLWEKDLFDLITISNTLKYKTEGFGIRWKRLFWWRKTSPLAKFGGGGLSGKPLFNALCDKILSLRRENICRGNLPLRIKASGGIMSARNARTIKACGADAIEFATVISLRPWRIYRLVKVAKKIFE